YLVGSSASGFLADRFGTAAVLMAGFGASAVALMGYAASPAVAVLLVASTVHGFGASSIDGGGNAYVALRHGPRVMNLLHASWGIGAAAGPAALTALLAAGSTWRLAYAAMVVVDVSLVAAVLATRRSWLAAGPPPAAASAGNGGAVPVPVVAGMLAMFFVCTGIEYSAGSWSYPFLVGRGLGTATAAGL